MLRGLLALICVLLLAGCGVGRAPETPAPRPDPARVALRDHVRDRETRIAAAEEVLVDDCMQARGMVYQPVPPPAEDWGLGLDPREDGDLDDARTWGFGLTQPPQPEADANRAYLEQLDENGRRAWDAALTGTPAAKVTVVLSKDRHPHLLGDGCVAQATIVLYGSVETYLRRSFGAQEAEQQLLRDALRSSTYRRALRAWSTCVGRSGYDDAGPPELIAGLAGQRGLTFRAEQRAAVASVRCAQTARLGSGAAAAYEAAQSRRPRLTSALQALDSTQAAAEDKAGWVLAEAGVTA